MITTIFLFLAILVFSCKKETSQHLTAQEEEQANVTASESDAEAEGVFNGIFDDVMGVNNEVGIAGTGIFARSAVGNGPGDVSRGDSTNPAPSCLILTIVHTTGTVFPIVITYDFGTGCVGSDGHFRKGKIITTYTNRLIVPGSSATTHFIDFYIDSIHVENTTIHTITNISSLDTLKYKIEVHAKLSKQNGNYSEWHSTKTITRISSNITPTIQDYFKVQGSAAGKVKRGDLLVAWRAEIVEPLIKRFLCRWISKGTVRIARENLSANSQWIGILNYGDGICDNKAILTINNIPHEITLH